MKSFLDFLVYVCAFCVVGVGALGAWDAVSEQPRVVLRGDGADAPEATVIPKPSFGKKTILLVGADERPNDVGRSDTIILLFLNSRTKKAAMLSIPRDLRVRIPGHGTQKINASYALGGVDLVRRTVEGEFGVRIDGYAKANFQGFVEIVDQLGGVEIDVPDVEGRGRGMNYDDRRGNLHIHLTPGVQLLDGEDAIGFVRYRKGDSDFKRSERQQQFLKAVAEQKLKLRNWQDLMRVVPKAWSAIDTDVGWREGLEMAIAVREVRPDNLLMTSFLPYLRDTKISGIYYVTISQSNVNRVLDEINQHLNSMPGQLNVVDVLNGSGQSGNAATAGTVLIDEGFEINDTGNANSFDHEKTQIYYPNDALAAARRAQRVLGAGNLVEIEEDTGYPSDRITIVLGTDIDPKELTGQSGRD